MTVVTVSSHSFRWGYDLGTFLDYGAMHDIPQGLSHTCLARKDSLLASMSCTADSHVSRRGTLPYMAPELVSDPDHVSEKADVWSLGMVLWEMLCLETPFQALTPQQIIAGLMVGNLAPEARPLLSHSA